MNSEVSVIPLGTVSPKPTLNNNGPGFLIRVGDNNIILDCGDGVSKLLDYNDFKNLNILISHFHLDHYIGLGTLAYHSYVSNTLGILNDRINIFYPGNEIEIPGKDDMGWYTTEYEKTMEVFKWLIDDLDFFNYEEYDYLSNITNNNYSIEFCEGLHEPTSYFIKIKASNGITIVYSGDTGYDKKFAKFIDGADLFICESSFYKGIPKSVNHHLYAFEAAKLAKLGNVKQLMLTHFYPNVDKNIYLNEAKEIFENTIVAEEGKKLVLERGK